MHKEKREFIELLLQDKKLKLEFLAEEHRKAIAVYEASRDMLNRDISIYESELAKANKKE